MVTADRDFSEIMTPECEYDVDLSECGCEGDVCTECKGDVYTLCRGACMYMCVEYTWCGYVSVCEFVCMLCHVHMLDFCVCKSV